MTQDNVVKLIQPAEFSDPLTGLGMETMGLTRKMQRAAAHPADVMVLAHQSPAAFDVAA